MLHLGELKWHQYVNSGINVKLKIYENRYRNFRSHPIYIYMQIDLLKLSHIYIELEHNSPASNTLVHKKTSKLNSCNFDTGHKTVLLPYFKLHEYVS